MNKERKKRSLSRVKTQEKRKKKEKGTKENVCGQRKLQILECYLIAKLGYELLLRGQRYLLSL